MYCERFYRMLLDDRNEKIPLSLPNKLLLFTFTYKWQQKFYK